MGISRQRFPKITIVAPNLSIVGGTSVQTKMLNGHLSADGYEVDFIPVNPPFPRRASWLKRSRFLRALASEVLYLPSLGRLRHADVVHIISAASHWSFVAAPVPAIVTAHRLKKPIILNYYSDDAAEHLAHGGSLVHPFLKMVDEIVVPSMFLHDIFAEHGYRTRVLHSPIDMTMFRYRRRAPLLPTFVSVRNLDLHCGVEDTLIAFALLRNSFPGATLTIAGQGPQETEFKHLADSLALRNVRFVGPVDAASVGSLYDGHSIFLNSCHMDNQPWSILSAMASGLPVVTTGVGDIPAMIEDGVTGTLVPVGDPAAMAKAAVQLLEHPQQALRMSQRAKDSLTRYTWATIGPAWAEVYRRLAVSPSEAKAA